MSLLFALACHPKDKATGADSALPPVPTERPLADGLSIDKIKLYQGTESVMFAGADAAPEGQPPIIAGRDAQVRVFVDLDPDFAIRKVTGILTIADGAQETVLEDTFRVEVDSKPALFDSTFDFAVDGSLVTPTATLSVRLVEELPTGLGGGDPADVEWAGSFSAVSLDPLTIVIIPIVYEGDGSNRLPDLSEAQLARIHDLAYGIYPAGAFELRVDAPYEWPDPVLPLDITAWGALLNRIVIERAYANEPPNTYYYGLFSPADSALEYCAAGCILGLSYVGYTPEVAALRASIGVGFSGDIASTTLVHEVGHAHGREHAPCGLYGQPSDPGYPYGNALIGAWGWDSASDTWFDPDENRDMMSYCGPLWVSDYTWVALAERAQEVSTPSRSARAMRSTVFLDADGVATVGPEVDAAGPLAGPARSVEVFDAAGVRRGTRSGTFYPLDHGDGGMVVLEERLPEGWTAR